MARKCRVLEGGYCEITWGYKKGTHNGIDLVGPNSTIKWETAHSDGTVVAVKSDCNYNTYKQGGPKIYGNYVKIKHEGGYYTLYAHIKYGTVKVKVGQKLKRGDVIGLMGNTGYSNGIHLHFEVRNPSDATIDPTPYLDADLPNGGGSKQVNVYYKVRTKKHGWLPEVKNLEDYAGWEGSPITALAVKVDKGSVWYQAHIKGGGWLPKVTGYNINDFYNGYAGDGRVIDCVKIYYNTPSDIRPYKRAKYRINNYPYQYDDETTKGQDGYAGEYGVDAKELRIIIE